MENYEVIVGNLGVVYSGENKSAALQEAKEYAALSNRGYGRVSGESVIVLDDVGTIVFEHEQTNKTE